MEVLLHAGALLCSSCSSISVCADPWPTASFIIARIPSFNPTKIRESVADIANFVGVRADLLDTSRSHAFKATKRFGVLARMDSDFVDAKVREHCADLMSEYFPEIRSVRDVMTRLRAD